MEIKAVNQNQLIKNIYIKNNDVWNKFETSSTDKPNNKIVLNNDLKFTYNTGTTLDLSNYDFSNVTDMRYMFYSCANLESLIPNYFDNSKVISMYNAFKSCKKLSTPITIDFHNRKINVYHLFNYCSNLTEVTLSNTIGLDDYYCTFSECIKLQRINGELDFFNVIGTSMMFHNNKELVEVKIKNLGRIDYLNSISFWASSKLSKESILYLFNNAFDRASAGHTIFTISLHADAKTLLSEEEIAIATTKGFTIA